MAWMEQLQSANWSQATACALGAYVLGCFTTGYYLVRARTGRDIRETDSGNVGARNVSRLLGRPGFVVTFAADFAKGVLAVWATLHFTGNSHLAALAMLAVVAGHVWPAQLHLRGGKGVATSLGALLAFDFQLAAAFVVLFLGAAAVTRKMILPGLFAYAGLPLVSLWLTPDRFQAMSLLILAAMILFAHRTNVVEEIPALAARRGESPKPDSAKP